MPKVGKIFRSKTWKLVGLAFLIIGLAAGILLVKQSQDIRERADDQCSLCYSGCETDSWPENCRSICDLWACASSTPAGSNSLPGSDNGGSGTECNSDSDCKAPRKCQNHQCIGNPGGKVLKKCQIDSDCADGYACSEIGSFKRCVPSTLVR